MTSTGELTLLQEVKAVATTVAGPHQEIPSLVARRRIVVVVTLIAGALVLGFSLRTEAGDPSFYLATALLAGVWFFGAFLSGPIHMGCINFRGRNRRPVITGTVIGLALGAVFVVGGLVVREIPAINEFIRNVLLYANQGNLLLIVTITVVNGLTEEIFFRGALYSALGRHYPVLVSTVIYIAVTLASGNPMLGFAAIILGTVCALERRATGGVLAPMLTHFFWGLIMVLALPPVFGLH